MDSTRREFLQSAVVGGALFGASSLLPGSVGSAFADERKKLRLLILGGTSFLGPHTVQAALARGHEMTLFNRGKTNPHLFPELEKLQGDRYSDMSALKGRQWDAVIDTFAYVPHVVTNTCEILKGAVKQYVLISSISVYAKFDQVGMDESAPLATVSDDIVAKTKTHREVGEHYGALKALCEQAAEQAMPGRVTNIRPGLIVGPDDPSDRFTYWPVRVARGGEVLAPGSPADPIQVIDVRDLGAWIIACIEKQVVGVYNADSPAGALNMGKLLDTCKEVAKSDARFTWADSEFLKEQKVAPWSDMPVWIPPSGDDIGFAQVSTKKAAEKGLTHRPLPETVKDTLKWWGEQSEERRANLRSGIKPEREQEVLKAWHERDGG